MLHKFVTYVHRLKDKVQKMEERKFEGGMDGV